MPALETPTAGDSDRPARPAGPPPPIAVSEPMLGLPVLPVLGPERGPDRDESTLDDAAFRLQRLRYLREALARNAATLGTVTPREVDGQPGQPVVSPAEQYVRLLALRDRWTRVRLAQEVVAPLPPSDPKVRAYQEFLRWAFWRGRLEPDHPVARTPPLWVPPAPDDPPVKEQRV